MMMTIFDGNKMWHIGRGGHVQYPRQTNWLNDKLVKCIALSWGQFTTKVLKKLDMCLWNMDGPGGNKVKIWQKSPKSYILTPAPPQGHGMSVKCEEPLNELTVQVWLLYFHPNFYYWTLFVSGAELRTDRQTDNPITRCPGGPFRPGA